MSFRLPKVHIGRYIGVVLLHFHREQKLIRNTAKVQVNKAINLHFHVILVEEG